MKKKSSLRDFFSKYEQYLKWSALSVVAIIAVVRFYYLPERLEAAEKEIIDIKEYTKAERENKKSEEDAIKNAPPGWQWNQTVQSYVVWPEDPRLKKR